MKTNAQTYKYCSGQDTITGDFKDIQWWNKIVAKKFSHGEYLIVTEIQPWFLFNIYCSRIGLPTINPNMIWKVEEYEFNSLCIGDEYGGSKHGIFYILR